jgi:hypothetical protein
MISLRPEYSDNGMKDSPAKHTLLVASLKLEPGRGGGSMMLGVDGKLM